MASVDLLLWDFGDTLVYEHWMWACPDGVPEWTDVWRTTMAELRDVWDVGTIHVVDVAEAMAAKLTVSVDSVRSHMSARCRDLVWFGNAWGAARRRGRPQALVTINPDVFSEVVEAYALADTFDLVLTSATERTLDKAELCARAVARLGGSNDRALLLDNLPANVDAWRARGGLGYVFVSDEQFGEDLARGGWDGLTTE